MGLRHPVSCEMEISSERERVCVSEYVCVWIREKERVRERARGCVHMCKNTLTLCAPVHRVDV